MALTSSTSFLPFGRVAKELWNASFWLSFGLLWSHPNEIFFLVPRVTLIFFDRAACCLKPRDYGRRVFKREILGYMQTSWLCRRLFRVGTSSRSAGTFSCRERVVGVGKAKRNNKAGAWRSSLLYSEASFFGLDRVSDCAVWLSPAKVVRVCDFVLKTFFWEVEKTRELPWDKKRRNFYPVLQKTSTWSSDIDLWFRRILLERLNISDDDSL